MMENNLLKLKSTKEQREDNHPANTWDQILNDRKEKNQDFWPVPLYLFKKIFLRIPPNANILDLGCGNGGLTREIAKQNYKVTGIDFATKTIQSNSKDIPEAKFLALDITKEDLPQIYDVIIMKFFLGCLRDSDDNQTNNKNEEKFPSKKQIEFWNKVIKKIKRSCRQLIIINQEPTKEDCPTTTHVPSDIMKLLLEKNFNNHEIIDTYKTKDEEFNYVTYIASKPILFDNTK